VSGGYRLEALLVLRERAEEEAQRALAEALAALEAARGEAHALAAALARHREEREGAERGAFEAALHGGGELETLARADDYGARLRREEAALEERARRAVLAVEAAGREAEGRREALAHAARERQALASHREAWAAEQRQAREKREELAQEEVADALRSRRREPPPEG
jgi:flagellar biosynthesis chaperone FliJ